MEDQDPTFQNRIKPLDHFSEDNYTTTSVYVLYGQHQMCTNVRRCLINDGHRPWPVTLICYLSLHFPYIFPYMGVVVDNDAAELPKTTRKMFFIMRGRKGEQQSLFALMLLQALGLSSLAICTFSQTRTL